MNLENVIAEYKLKKRGIKKRLRDFRKIHEGNKAKIFEELCFCILTPQAKAVICDEAIKKLKKRNLLFKGSIKSVRECLKGIRFPNNKAEYLVNIRGIDIKRLIDRKDIFKTRDLLVKDIRGIGYKEASHFLRNIGLGKDLAILDRHILKNIKALGIIKKIPDVLSKKEYIKIENRMQEFFSKAGIPIEEVDLLFWSRETGFIFK